MKAGVGTLIAGVVLAVAATAVAQSGGMGDGMDMGMGKGMQGGIVVAGDGTVLSVVPGDDSTSIMAIGSNGAIRWNSPVTDGHPMTIATNGDLVVALVANDDGMMGGGGSGGSGGGMGGGGNGGGMGGGGGMGDGEQADHSFRLVGLALSNGEVRWSTQFDGAMAMSAVFSPSGTSIYVVANETGTGNGHDGGRKLIAVGRDGAILWSTDFPTVATSASGAGSNSHRQ